MRTIIASCLGPLLLALSAQSVPAAGAIPPLTVTPPAYARLYVQLSRERPGRMAAWRETDGTIRVIYQYRTSDGCVTDIRSTINVDVVGAPVWERHTGQACGPRLQVDESYSRSGSLGIWKNHLGEGRGDVIGKKFYTSASNVPEERALLVRALLAAGNQLQLLPEGEAWLERLRSQALTTDRHTETVTQYRVSGLTSGPSLVWLDSRSELFATGDDLIREGWESAARLLR